MKLPIMGRRKAENILVAEHGGDLAVDGDKILARIGEIGAAAGHGGQGAQVLIRTGKADGIRRKRPAII